MAITEMLQIERVQAMMVILAPYIAIGDTTQVQVLNTSHWLARPANATFVQIQNQDAQVHLRYRYDDLQTGPAMGFILDSLSDALIPVCGRGVSVCSEGAMLTMAYQWFR